MNTPTITLEMSQEDAAIIGNALAARPYGEVWQTVDRLRAAMAQAQAQALASAGAAQRGQVVPMPQRSEESAA